MLGWGEFELEVMRDRNDNVVVICSIENVDPMGVHGGLGDDRARQTLTDRLYQELRPGAVIRAVGVETGGSNIQFAVNPATGEIVVIEMNPRVSRSSAARLEGDRLPDREDRQPSSPRLRARGDRQRHHRDHAGVVRAHDRLRGHQGPRFAFEKFPGAEGGADHPHEVGRRGDGDRPHVPRVVREGDALARARRGADLTGETEELLARLETPAPDRFDVLLEAFAAAPRSTRWDADLDRSVAPARAARPGGRRRRHRRARAHVPLRRHLRGRVRGPDAVLLLGSRAQGPLHGEVRRGDRDSIVILGSGPNRIGQGIEFDYCCVHAAMTVRESGRDAVMINCNPRRSRPTTTPPTASTSSPWSPTCSR